MPPRHARPSPVRRPLRSWLEGLPWTTRASATCAAFALVPFAIAVVERADEQILRDQGVVADGTVVAYVPCGPCDRLSDPTHYVVDVPVAGRRERLEVYDYTWGRVEPGATVRLRLAPNEPASTVQDADLPPPTDSRGWTGAAGLLLIAAAAIYLAPRGGVRRE